MRGVLEGIVAQVCVDEVWAGVGHTQCGRVGIVLAWWTVVVQRRSVARFVCADCNVPLYAYLRQRVIAACASIATALFGGDGIDTHAPGWISTVSGTHGPSAAACSSTAAASVQTSSSSSSVYRDDEPMVTSRLPFTGMYATVPCCLARCKRRDAV